MVNSYFEASNGVTFKNIVVHLNTKSNHNQNIGHVGLTSILLETHGMSIYGRIPPLEIGYKTQSVLQMFHLRRMAYNVM